MSQFSSYEKMPTSLKKLGLTEKEFSQLEKLKWVVTEKVHGANFSFVYENGQLKFAKRKAYLAWDDDFFGFQLVVNQLENQILSLFEQLSTELQGKKYILYGELFGGEYPHPEVPSAENLQAIQTGVYYAPDIHFLAFDIAVETGNAEKQYLDYGKAISYFEAHTLLYARPLFIGKFADAIGFNTRMNSQIPKALRLPLLTENLIEGVVIKSFDPLPASVSKRPIFKRKNPEFDEEKRFHQAQKWSFIPSVSSKSEDLGFILDELRNYVNHNRLESAVSKIGALDLNNKTRVREIEQEVLEDVLGDFDENNDGFLGDLGAEEISWLRERLRAEVRKLVLR